jgi:hypothetical protein
MQKKKRKGNKTRARPKGWKDDQKGLRYVMTQPDLQLAVTACHGKDCMELTHSKRFRCKQKSLGGEIIIINNSSASKDRLTWRL